MALNMLLLFAAHLAADYFGRGYLGLPGFPSLLGYLLWWVFLTFGRRYRASMLVHVGSLFLWPLIYWLDLGMPSWSEVMVHLDRVGLGVMVAYATMAILFFLTYGREPDNIWTWVPPFVAYVLIWYNLPLGEGPLYMDVVNGFVLLLVVLCYAWHPWVNESYGVWREEYRVVYCSVCKRPAWVKIGRYGERVYAEGGPGSEEYVAVLDDAIESIGWHVERGLDGMAYCPRCRPHNEREVVV